MNDLVNWVSITMPDEYPRGFAEYIAKQMIKNKEVIVKNEK